MTAKEKPKSHLETLPARRGGPGPGIPQICCPRLRANDCCYSYPKTPPVALLQLGEVGGHRLLLFLSRDVLLLILGNFTLAVACVWNSTELNVGFC